MSTNPTIRDIDLAWERINALGGTPCCAHDHVYVLAISDCLRIIESLGGYDPAARRHARQAQPITPPHMRAADVLPDDQREPVIVVDEMRPYEEPYHDG